MNTLVQPEANKLNPAQAPRLERINHEGVRGTAQPGSLVDLLDLQGQPVMNTQGQAITVKTNPDGQWHVPAKYIAGPVAQGYQARAWLVTIDEEGEAGEDLVVAQAEAAEQEWVTEQAGADVDAEQALASAEEGEFDVAAVPLIAPALGGGPLLAGLGALGLAGAGGGGGGTTIITAAGVVVDGYIAGATVSRVNGSGQVTTDGQGRFQGLTGTGDIVVEGGVDISTGLRFTGRLIAPEGSSVITPLTSLVHALESQGQSREQAITLAKTFVGIPGSSFDVLNDDPIASSHPHALAFLKAGVIVATAIQSIATTAAAFDVVTNQIALDILNPVSQRVPGGNPPSVNSLNAVYLDSLSDRSSIEGLRNTSFNAGALAARLNEILDAAISDDAAVAIIQQTALIEQLGVSTIADISKITPANLNRLGGSLAELGAQQVESLTTEQAAAVDNLNNFGNNLANLTPDVIQALSLAQVAQLSAESLALMGDNIDNLTLEQLDAIPAATIGQLSDAVRTKLIARVENPAKDLTGTALENEFEDLKPLEVAQITDEQIKTVTDMSQLGNNLASLNPAAAAAINETQIATVSNLDQLGDNLANLDKDTAAAIDKDQIATVSNLDQLGANLSNLNKDTAAAIDKEQIATVSNLDQLGGNLANLNKDTAAAIDEGQIATVSNLDQLGDNLANLNPKAAAAIDATQIATVSDLNQLGANLANLTPDVIQALSLAQVAQLSAESLALMGDNIDNLTLEQLDAIPAATIGQLSDEVRTKLIARVDNPVDGLKGPALEDKLAELKPLQVAQITADQIKTVTDLDKLGDNLASLDKDTAAAIDATQISTLKNLSQLGDNLANLSDEALEKINKEQATTITAPQLNLLNEAQIGRIAPDVIGALTPAVLGGLSAEVFGFLTDDQLTAIVPLQIIALPPEALALVPSSALLKLNEDQVSQIQPEAFKNISALALGEMNEKGILGKVTIDQVSELNTSQLEHVPNERLIHLANEQKELIENNTDQPNEWDLSELTRLNFLFYNSDFNDNISDWNTSAVTEMNYVFAKNNKFNQNIGDWDTEAVTRMNGTFLGASAFNQNIGKWNTSSVTSMNDMFSGASAFNQDIGNWDVSSLTSATNMFKDSGLSTKNFDSILAGWSSVKTSQGETGLQSNVDFGDLSGIEYTNATARQYLIDNHGWEINAKLRDGVIVLDNDKDNEFSLRDVPSGSFTIHGLGGNDTIIGSGGNDHIYGGFGDDILTGGLGADTFWFMYAGEGDDTITDFNTSEGDAINLEYLLDGATKDNIAAFIDAVSVSDGAHTRLDIRAKGDDTVTNTILLQGVNVGSVDFADWITHGHLVIG